MATGYLVDLHAQPTDQTPSYVKDTRQARDASFKYSCLFLACDWRAQTMICNSNISLFRSHLSIFIQNRFSLLQQLLQVRVTQVGADGLQHMAKCSQPSSICTDLESHAVRILSLLPSTQVMQ